MATNDIIKTALDKQGIPREVALDQYQHLVEMFQQAVAENGPFPACSSVGHTLNYRELGELAGQFASYLQHCTDLEPGDRIAIQMPNIIQYQVALYGAMMAGMIIVNTNPMYQPRELEHQLHDSGAKAIVVLANIAEPLQEVIANTDVRYVIMTEIADLHPPLKRAFINGVVKYIKRMVPNLQKLQPTSLLDALKQGRMNPFIPVEIDENKLAVLQYTGGTTGVAKGAMLTHRNLKANVLQCVPLFDTFGVESQSETMVMPLPLYHIYSFTVCMLMLVRGNHVVFVPDPRNTPTVVQAMQDYDMTMFCGINSLFVKLCMLDSFKKIDFSRLKLTLSGGMALTHDAAMQWEELTNSQIYQGYGLTETSPVVSINTGTNNQVTTIGLAVPSTDIKIMGDNGEDVPQGERGELCVRGPQVMKGYWQREEATAEVIDQDGWFATGDIAVIQEDGYLKIVDRKKDMILVSGFNVYPNELEDVLTEHPDVIECAAIGVPDDAMGERIKMFVVANKEIDKQELIAFCKDRLTGYKVPREFEFIDELPKSSVGKILRKDLR